MRLDTERVDALLPFDGDDAERRLEAGRSGRVLRRFGFDGSGTKSYAFSTLGFRGEELDAFATRRIFACGASVAFGSGLDEDETWLAQFRPGYAREHDLDARAVNLLNFSAPLAPPDYVVRTLLLQSFCQARGIELLLLWDRRPHEPWTALFAEPVFAPLLSLLDPRVFCRFSVFDPDVFVDRSADGIHPGPDASRLIASRVLSQYRRLRAV